MMMRNLLPLRSNRMPIALAAALLVLAAAACMGTPTAAPPQDGFNEPIYTPASLEPMLAPAQAIESFDESWSGWENSNPAFIIRYPANWEPRSLESGVALYPPGSNPDLPSPSIRFEWLNVEYTPGVPLVPSWRALETRALAGISGQRYEDSQFASPMQAEYMEFPYAGGVLFISATTGPEVNLSAHLWEILGTFEWLEGSLAATEAPLAADINMDAYCDDAYGTDTYAFITDRWDAYSWGCYLGDQFVGGIDTGAACRSQHPEQPNPVMGDRWDAYSWSCTGD